MPSLKYLLLILLLLLAIAIPLAMSFGQGNTGSIEGFVLDQAGIPVARATVQVTNLLHGGVPMGRHGPPIGMKICSIQRCRILLAWSGKGRCHTG